jgi:general stress protein 26
MMDNNLQKEKLNYDETVKAKVKFLEAHNYMAIATSHNDKVTVRTVTYVSDAMNIYFLSCLHHTKCVQIEANPNVAACIDNIQIQGKAEILGKPLDERNKEYADIYRKKLPAIFEIFSKKPEIVMVKMVPEFFKTFVRDADCECLQHLDLKNKTAYVFEEFK